MCYNTVTMIKYSTKVKLVSGNVLRMGVLAPVLNKFNTHPRVMNLLDDGGAQLTFLHTYGKVVLININNSLLSPVKDALLSSRGNCDLILQDDVNLAIKMIRSINDSDYYTYNYARYFKTDNIV